MAHGLNTQTPAELEFAHAVAETMQALSTPSRLRILGRLRAGPCPVNELASSVGVEPLRAGRSGRLPELAAQTA